MAKTLRIAGLIWCYAVGLLILASLVMILLRRGFGAFFEMLSPFNVANVVVTVIALAPGLILLGLADRVKHDRPR